MMRNLRHIIFYVKTNTLTVFHISLVYLYEQKIKELKDTLKAFDDFRNKQEKCIK